MKTETILVIGSGAREHAIAEAFARSSQCPRLFCFAGARNPGILELTVDYQVGDIADPASVAKYAVERGATLAVIGPEAPLAAGVADALWAEDVPVVGPTQHLARIESSKGFTRELLRKHQIPGNPIFERFESMSGVKKMLASLPMQHVIKDDGLAGGKGVRVCGDQLFSYEDSLSFCHELIAQGRPLVIEEKLEGEEFSLMSFSDGKTLRHMPAVQDHKRAYDGDRGPNTGGMGTYSDADFKLPFLVDQDISEARSINEQVVAALAADCGAPYRGILYGGFMATKDGVRLIEYNARFGDPESLNLLTLLKTDFVDVCRGIVDGRLDSVDVEFAEKASVCRYLVPEGYPDQPRKGDTVSLPDSIEPGVRMYLGAVDIQEGRLISTGSRTVAFVGVGDTLAEAEKICASVIKAVGGRFFSRTDIGTGDAISRRVQHMRELRTR